MNTEQMMDFLHELNDGAFNILINHEFEGKKLHIYDSSDNSFTKYLAGFYIDDAVELNDELKKMIIENNGKGLIGLIESLPGEIIGVSKGTFDIDAHNDEKGTIDINMGIYIREEKLISDELVEAFLEGTELKKVEENE